jgi:hypothetical protein
MPDNFDDQPPVGDPHAGGWDLLAEAMDRDPVETTDRILRTLEANKVEAKFQDWDQPRIFLKKFDDLELVISVAVNPHCSTSIPMPRTEFNDKLRRRLFKMLDTTDEAVRGIFLAASQIEKVTLAGALEVTNSDITPPLRKQFDENGFPTHYALNWPAEHVHLGKKN